MPRGRPAAPRRPAARELLDAVDVAGLADRRPAQLSGGQQQRVALARALAAGPDLLLLDEPLAALDVDTMPAMRALLRRTLRDSGRTAVLVTHAALDALVLADRVVVLSDGVVVEEGPTREVLARPRSPFAARIAGLDLVPGLACPEGLKTADGFVITGQAEGTVTGEPAVAVFPPAAVAVFAEHPHGSPRNVVQVRLAAVEPHGDLVRLRAGVRDGGPAWADGLAADVTPAALVDLPAEPGVQLWFAVKAAEVAIHPAAVRRDRVRVRAPIPSRSARNGDRRGAHRIGDHRGPAPDGPSRPPVKRSVTRLRRSVTRPPIVSLTPPSTRP